MARHYCVISLFFPTISKDGGLALYTIHTDNDELTVEPFSYFGDQSLHSCHGKALSLSTMAISLRRILYE